MNGKTHSSEPQEIIMALDVVFTLRFERDTECGGYLVRCDGLPEVIGYSRTIKEARVDVAVAIRDALEDRAKSGDAMPNLQYSPPWHRKRDWPPEDLTKRRIRGSAATFIQK